MEAHQVKILETGWVTHNVRRFRVEKPEAYVFSPGQATEVAIPLPEWQEEKRPFTFTSLNEWPFLEFTIKIYPEHKGVTDALGRLKEGDSLLIHDVWGAIEYKGPGAFIAGGAGITPFIAILRELHEKDALSGCSLYFSNKTEKDIILKEELTEYLGAGFHNTLTQQQHRAYGYGRIDAAYLREHIDNFDQHFYICGPDEFVQRISGLLEEEGARADALVFEK